MSKPRSPVHAANTSAWKPFDFLSLPGSSAQGFSAAEFRGQVEPGFHHARIEAMPDNSLRAPARWRPAPHSAETPTEPDAATAALSAPMHEPHSPMLDPQQAEPIRAQAFEDGLAQGRLEGEAAARETLQPQIEAAQQQGVQDIRDLLIQLGEAVADLRQRPETLHAPLKRLALHIAEELVLGELSLSATAIDRLVQRCLDAVDGQSAKQLVVELHPDDLTMLQQHPDAEADRPSGWTWQANNNLLPGSVRVRMDEAVVSDLIEHRLQALAKQLLGQTSAWSARSAFEPSRLAERRRQDHPVEDALPRMGAMQEPALDERLPAWAQTPQSVYAEASDETPADALASDMPETQASAPDTLSPEFPHEDDGHA